MGNYIRNLIGFPKQIKIAMVGLDASGKTTILYKLKLNSLVTTLPTIGVNVETVNILNIDFIIFDFGTTKTTKIINSHYLENTNALIFVIDSFDRERIHLSFNELKSTLSFSSIQNIPILIFANKQDLPNSMKENEIIENLHLNELNYNWHIQLASAITGEGLYEGFNWLNNQI
eukprot:TRINITY_DN456_c0_g1_i1.p1 TRINITY_DN456_c0_g1~~TRINITY_DN456_c0_g1_i1.p1  ORF type:complete len:174 (-),score=68.56 TRINITY_DN456_c0_g1_i1:127-648(-)